MLISLNPNEKILIESSYNSTRISVRFRNADQLEEYQLSLILRFLHNRVEEFLIIRRKPLPSFHLSFLVCDFHVQHFSKERIADWIVMIVHGVNLELSENLLSFHTRFRIASRHYLLLFETHADVSMCEYHRELEDCKDNLRQGDEDHSLNHDDDNWS